MGVLSFLKASLSSKERKTEVLTSDNSSSILSVGSSPSGKGKWKKKDMPPQRFVRIRSAVTIGESVRQIEGVLTKSTIEWLETMSRLAVDSRKQSLFNHGQDFEPTEWTVESLRWALREARDLGRGQFREYSLTRFEEYEHVMFALRTMCGHAKIREVEDCVRTFKEWLAPGHEWFSNDQTPVEEIVSTLRFGDWWMGADGVPVTIDGSGQKYIWTPYTPPPEGTDETDHIISPNRRFVFQSSSGARQPTATKLRQMRPIEGLRLRLEERITSRAIAADKGKGKQVASVDDEDTPTVRDFATVWHESDSGAGPSWRNA